MKLSYNWLKQFIKIKLIPEQLAEKLTLAGFEVEKINYGSKIKGVKIGEIMSIRKHPKAKKLKILKVTMGSDGTRQIVCGASNIKRRQKVSVALAGAEIVGLDVDGKPGNEPLVIQETKIRGVKSEGILCAKDELGIGVDHTGIYILSSEVNVGQDINKVLDLDDVIFDLEITPNRGDCLSVLGLTREIAAATNSKLLNSDVKSISNFQFPISKQISNFQSPISIEVWEPELCPKYTARVIKNVRVEESPQWLKNRLRAVGIKSINNIVDITNYVMMELGQPLHAFDFEKIKSVEIPNSNFQIPNKSKIPNLKSQTIKENKIIVRKAKRGEKIVTINGKTQELDEEVLVIGDEKKPIAVAGIMGGENTEITEKTTDIILESAQFDPISIRKTARKLELQSDSSYRFERGVDWNMVENALDRATGLITQLANGVPSVAKSRRSRATKAKQRQAKAGQKTVVQQQERYLRRVIKLPVKKVSEVLGVKVSKQKIKDILKTLGFKIADCEATKLKSYEAKKLVEEAKKLVGRLYKYGAKESEAPKKFDCSSLIKYLYKKIGITIPRCSVDQAEIGEDLRFKIQDLRRKRGASSVALRLCSGQVPRSLAKKLQRKLKPGDLVFSSGSSPHYSLNYPDGLGHVGIYIGDGKVIHADGEKKRVIEETLEGFIERKKWLGARRILGIRRDPIASLQDDILIVTVPSWREDVSIPEDLIEEVGRVYDYNKLKPTSLKGETPFPKINKELAWENLIKDTLVAAGMIEVYNYSFYGRTQIDTDKSTDLHKNHLQVINPINSDQEFLRISLIPRLLEIAQKNSKNFEEIKIFEIGKIYFANHHESIANITNKLLDERKMVAGIIKYGTRNTEHGTFSPTKGVIELLFDKLGINKDKVNFKSFIDVKKNLLLHVMCPMLRKERSAVVTIDNEVLGLLGELESGIGLFELDFQKLIKHAKERKEFQAISYYPAVERDLAIVVDKDISYIDLNKAIKEINPLIKEIELFDIFEDEKKIGKNKKSLAFHLKFQSLDRTLKKKEVDNVFRNILKRLEDFGAKIRTRN